MKAPGPQYAPTPSRQELGIRPTKRHFPIFLLLALAMLPLAEPAVPSDRREAGRGSGVLAEIQRLDADLGHVIEAFNAEQVELDQIKVEQKVNNRRLKIARSNLGDAQNLEARLIDLYVNGSPDLVEIILGSASLDEILDGIESAGRVTDQDAQILSEVRRFKKEVKEREAKLAKARKRQEESSRRRRRSATRSKLRCKQREALVHQGRDRGARGCGAQAPGADQRCRGGAVAAPTSSSGDAPTGAPASQYGGVVGIAMQYLGTHMCGAAHRPAASTARASSCTSTRRLASRSRTTPRCSTATAAPSRARAPARRSRLLQQAQP